MSCLQHDLLRLLMVKDCLSPLCILTLAMPFASTLLFQDVGSKQEASITVSGFETRHRLSQSRSLPPSGCAGKPNDKTGAGDCTRSIENVFSEQTPAQRVNNLTANSQTQPGMLPEMLSLRPL